MYAAEVIYILVFLVPPQIWHLKPLNGLFRGTTPVSKGVPPPFQKPCPAVRAAIGKSTRSITITNSARGAIPNGSMNRRADSSSPPYPLSKPDSICETSHDRQARPGPTSDARVTPRLAHRASQSRRHLSAQKAEARVPQKALAVKNLRGDHCRCSVCGLEFNSTYAFDKHRTGDYSTRRCRSVDEMSAAGMVVSNSGWWLSSAFTRPILDRHAIAGAAIDPAPLPQGEGYPMNWLQHGSRHWP